MEYTLTPADDGQYIIVKAVGDGDREIANEIGAAAFALGEELGIRCFLNDLRDSRNVDTTLEQVRFTLEDVPQMKPKSSVYVAVLVDPKDHSHDFYVAFAQSQGVDIGLFWDHDEAIAQLRKAAHRLNSSPPEPS